MTLWLRLSLIAIVLGTSSLAARGDEVLRYEVGPWPVVSKLIGYRDRLWFANSVKGVNHNSADLYSISLAAEPPRYEGHLFSQDAGDPAVHRGLLYWPLEDARTGPGVGAFDVTDGERWAHGLIPTEPAYHAHAMAAVGDRLYAAPSAWQASIALSEDGGQSWDNIYLHPTPDRRVSRVTDLVTLGDKVFGVLNAPEGFHLIRVDDGSGDPVPGWPRGVRIASLTVHQGHLYGLVFGRDVNAIWRSDGLRSKRVWTAPENSKPAALTSDGRSFWMAGHVAGKTILWRSEHAEDWIEVVALNGGTAFDIEAYRDVVAVGGRGVHDRGVIWILKPDRVDDVETNDALPFWPPFDQAPSDDIDWVGEAARLDRLLADPASYERFGGQLRQAIMALPRQGVPPTFYPDRLQAIMPNDPLPMFGGIILNQMTVMGRWRLYWGMGLARSGRVDPADILRPWDYTPNRPFKFFSTPEIAIWAAGRLARPDPDVLDALVQRLEDEATPLWLKGDAAGALTAITSERYGYDADAWRRWLQGRS